MMLVIHSAPICWERSVEIKTNFYMSHERIAYAQNKLCHIGVDDGKYSERL